MRAAPELCIRVDTPAPRSARERGPRRRAFRRSRPPTSLPDRHTARRTVDALDELEQREEEAEHDQEDRAAHEDDQQRLDDRDEGADRDVHLLVVVVGDADEHLVELAGLLADVDHVHDDVVEDAALAERLGDRLALRDRLVDLVERASRTTLPAVSRQMSSASRIGTPDAISVPSVRAKRATMILRDERADDRELELQPVEEAPARRACGRSP